MNATARIILEPTWYIEFLLAVISLAAGIALIILGGFAHPGATYEALPTLAPLISDTALVIYGCIMVVASVAHVLALRGWLWPRPHLYRRSSTLFYFILFAYFTVVRVISTPTRVIWLALLFTTLVTGLCHIRLRLTDGNE